MNSTATEYRQYNFDLFVHITKEYVRRRNGFGFGFIEP